MQARKDTEVSQSDTQPLTEVVNEQQTETTVQTDQLYTPQPDEAHLTWRAIFTGCLIGGVVSCMNIYMGLKIGWSFGGSLIAAILGFAIFRARGNSLSVLETNITQTTGSGAGTMASAAGLLAPIPALAMMGQPMSVGGLFFWAISVAFLGVFFAVPLRRQMVLVEKLRFPTGTATAETIMAMFSKASDTLQKARALIWFGVGAGIFTLATYFVPALEMPPLKMLGIASITLAATWTFKLYFGPMLFGAGILIGPRVGFSLLGGSLVAWALLGPWAQQMGWAPGAVMDLKTGPRGWILWPGVAIMVGEALMSLLLGWKTFVRSFRSARPGDGSPDTTQPGQNIPQLWWIGGLVIASILTTTVAYTIFNIPPYLTIIAIILSSVLAIVAVRSTGETDINPVGGMGKVTQLVFGAAAPGMVTTNLMAAAITGSGASQAADMMQDLKTGHLLGASPKRQFMAQLIGIFAGILFCVPAYLLVTAAYPLGGEQLPAPAAEAWKAVAELLSIGSSALPPHALLAVILGVAFGALIPILKKTTQLGPWLPSGLAFGIAFIIPAYYSVTMFLGTMVLVVWRKKAPSHCKNLSFAVASGLVAGEGLFGIVKAAMTLLGVPTL